MATETEVAAHLHMTTRTVSEYKRSGVFVSTGRGGYDIDTCREAYILRLRGQAAGRKGKGGPNKPDLADERARLAAEQADAVAMKNAAARGDLVSASAISSAVVGMIELAKSRLMRVPAIVAKADPALRVQIAEAIETALEDLSATRVEADTGSGEMEEEEAEDE